MQLKYIEFSMQEMNKLRRVVKHILKEAKEVSEQEKATKLAEAQEAYKKQLRAAQKLKAGDMFGLFRIKQEKNWFELDEQDPTAKLMTKNAKHATAHTTQVDLSKIKSFFIKVHSYVSCAYL
jgi:hypothetical protein